MNKALTDLADASRGWAADAPSGRMVSATRAFTAAAAADPGVLADAASALGSQDPGSAAWIAVACGTLVERGGVPAEACGPAVVDLMLAWLPRLPTSGLAPGDPRARDDEDLPPPQPTREQAALLAQFRYLCQSAVTHLARMPGYRERLGRDAALLERLADLSGYSHGAWWVREALVKSSGSLVLLHPEGRVGARVAYVNVSNCFHLFSLLQTAVGTRLPGGRAPDETIARVARGKSHDAVRDEAWWHYGSPSIPSPGVQASIWGEGLARELPRIEGEQVILLWPPLLERRSWDAGFLGPHLEAMPADVSFTGMLAQQECETWLRRLGVQERSKPWWRFW